MTTCKSKIKTIYQSFLISSGKLMLIICSTCLKVKELFRVQCGDAVWGTVLFKRKIRNNEINYNFYLISKLFFYFVPMGQKMHKCQMWTWCYRSFIFNSFHDLILIPKEQSINFTFQWLHRSRIYQIINIAPTITLITFLEKLKQKFRLSPRDRKFLLQLSWSILILSFISSHHSTSC